MNISSIKISEYYRKLISVFMDEELRKEIELMNKTVKCLALELPESVWEDVNKNWQSVLQSLQTTEEPDSYSEKDVKKAIQFTRRWGVHNDIFILNEVKKLNIKPKTK